MKQSRRVSPTKSNLNTTTTTTSIKPIANRDAHMDDNSGACWGGHRSKKLKRNDWVRLLTGATILATIACAGFFPYYFFQFLEENQAESSFNSIARTTEDQMQKVISTIAQSTQLMKYYFLSHCPLAEHWPNCSVSPYEFEQLSDSLKAMAGMSSIGMAVAAYPGQTYQVEQYVSDVYLSANITSFGLWQYNNSHVRGIASVDQSTRQVLHDTQSPEIGQNNFLVPVVHFTGATRQDFVSTVLYNAYAEESRIKTIDSSTQCVLDSIGEEVDSTNFGCSFSTDFVVPQTTTDYTSPAGSTYHAVSIDGHVVGFTLATYFWDKILDASIPNYVSGIDIVMSTDSSSWTYISKEQYTTNGMPSGRFHEGDKHDAYYSSTKRSFALNVQGGGDFEYAIELYASDMFYAQYRTQRDVYACIIGLMVAVVTSLIFVVYDTSMVREAEEREVVLETKRALVRCVSHEIRTPLNTVNVGLKVLYQEIVALQTAEDLEQQQRELELEQQGQQEQHQQGQLLSHSLLADNNRQSSGVSNNSSSFFKTPRSIRKPLLTEAIKKELLGLVMEVEDSSDAAVDILNDLINYDKITAGTMNLDTELIDIWSFVEEMLNPFILQARQNDIALTLYRECFDNDELSFFERSIQRSLCVQGDTMKLKQVFRNLLSNALKFTKPGGEVSVAVRWEPDAAGTSGSGRRVGEFSPRLFSRSRSNSSFSVNSITNNSGEAVSTSTTQLCGAGGNFIISVTDSGVGITAEQMKDLFKEGMQFNANKLQGGKGSGLGLFITKGVVMLHGGTIHARSEGEDKGCTFSVSLPSVLPPSGSGGGATMYDAVYDEEAAGAGSKPGTVPSTPAAAVTTSDTIPICNHTNGSVKKASPTIDRGKPSESPSHSSTTKQQEQGYEREKSQVVDDLQINTQQSMSATFENSRNAATTAMSRAVGGDQRTVEDNKNINNSTTNNNNINNTNTTSTKATASPSSMSRRGHTAQMQYPVQSSRITSTSTQRDLSEYSLAPREVSINGNLSFSVCIDDEVPSINSYNNRNTNTNDISIHKNHAKAEKHVSSSSLLSSSLILGATSTTAEDPLQATSEGGEGKRVQSEGRDISPRFTAASGSSSGNRSPSHLATATSEHNICGKTAGLNVLIVDDSSPSRKMMARLLSNAGYSCHQAADGRECVDMVVDNYSSSSSSRKVRRFDIIFLDFEMPVMNGPDAAAELRRLGYTLPIIGVTGNVLPADQALFKAHGANDILTKPLKLTEFEAIIKKHFESKVEDSSSTHHHAAAAAAADASICRDGGI